MSNLYQAPRSALLVGSPINVAFGKAWLVFFLVATVAGGLFGAIVGAVLGLVLASLGFGITAIQIAGGIVGFVLSVPISFFTYRWSVQRFIVAPLLATMASSEVPAQVHSASGA